MTSPANHIHVGPEVIHPQEAHAFVSCAEAGAVAQFLGTVRNHNDGAEVIGLAYEAYQEMAEAEIGKIVDTASTRWTLLGTHTVHRIGTLDIGAIAVCVTVSSAHRDDAFAACRFIIDELKQSVPIWKNETLSDGVERWLENPLPDASLER